MTNATHFEAKKHAYRQTQDGIVVSFTVHPNDVSTELAMAPLGTRFMVAIAEMTDEQPPGDDAPPTSSSTAAPQGGSSTAAISSKERRNFGEMRLSEQAGIRCGDQSFVAFLHDQYPVNCMNAGGDPAETVRRVCCVKSRAEFDIDFDAASLWRTMDQKFQIWLTTRDHADIYR